MGRPTTLPEPWCLLVERLGSVQAVADALHSTPWTISRWATGQRAPRGPALALIEQVFRKHRVPVPKF
jgi:hypothetical protein